MQSTIQKGSILLKKLFLIIRIILSLVFLGMAIWFVIPMMSYIINIGNIFGSLICLAGFFVTAFWNNFKDIFKRICRNNFVKWAMRIVYVIIILVFAYIAIISGFIITAANKSPDADSTVIVLGCQVRGTDPSLMLLKRLEAALDYLNSNRSAICIVSGGKGDNEYISEAQCMFNYLTEHGIADERIICEDKSSTTSENLEFSKKIIEEHNLSKNIAIVTDGFHEFRAGIIAKKAGLTPTGAVSADTPLYLLATYHLRETIAIANELVFG